MLDLLVERRQAELTDRVVIEVEADGFLYNMVRNIVGTLVAVGKGREQPVAGRREVLAAPRPDQGRHDRAGAGAVFGGGGVREDCRIAECRIRNSEEETGDAEDGGVE